MLISKKRFRKVSGSGDLTAWINRRLGIDQVSIVDSLIESRLADITSLLPAPDLDMIREASADSIALAMEQIVPHYAES
jgi:hypothetical protein